MRRENVAQPSLVSQSLPDRGDEEEVGGESRCWLLTPCPTGLVKSPEEPH